MTDKGHYECQVNTEPKINLGFWLNILRKLVSVAPPVLTLFLSSCHSRHTRGVLRVCQAGQHHQSDLHHQAVLLPAHQHPVV